MAYERTRLIRKWARGGNLNSLGAARLMGPTTRVGRSPRTCRIPIVGIGTDIESVGRFRRVGILNDTYLLEKIFTKSELRHCRRHPKPDEMLAACFTAKEAVYKALSRFGRRALSPTDIEIVFSRFNVPRVNLLKSRARLEVCLSISHSRDNAIAFAVACKRP